MKPINEMSKQEYDDYMCKTYPTYFADRHKPMTVTCMCWGFDIGPGWYALLDDLCKELVTIKALIIFDQIKEKYATLRAYYHFDEETIINLPRSQQADNSNEIDKIIEKYENLSGETCETCGKEGETCTRGGWYRTCCPECAKKDQYMSLKDFENAQKQNKAEQDNT